MLFDFISLEKAPGFVRLAIFSLERQTPWEAASSLGELEDHLLRAAGKALKSGNRTHPKRATGAQSPWVGRREPGRCSCGQGFDGCGISGGEPQEKRHLERAQGPGLHREPCRGSEGVLRPVNLCEAEMFLHLSQLPLVSQRTENARRVEKKRAGRHGNLGLLGNNT